MTDSARKERLNQFFGSKRYLYQDNERVAHIHVVNDTYYFHGHIVPGNKRFYSNDVERNCFVTFHVDSILCNVTGYVSINDKFTVQEEI